MAKTEEFRLQTLLNLKENLVDTLEVEFAHLKAAHQAEVGRLQRLQRSKTEEMEFLSEEQQRNQLDCHTIQQHQQYLQTLSKRVHYQMDRVKQAEHHVEDKREELVQMMQDQKVLEKLREQHEAKQRQILNHQEAGMLDDLVITRYARERR